jgi:hypothetical protein
VGIDVFFRQNIIGLKGTIKSRTEGEMRGMFHSWMARARTHLANSPRSIANTALSAAEGVVITTTSETTTVIMDEQSVTVQHQETSVQALVPALDQGVVDAGGPRSFARTFSLSHIKNPDTTEPAQ